MSRFRLAAAVIVAALCTLLATACGSDTSGADASLASGQQSNTGAIAGYTLSIPKLNESSPLVGLGLNADKSIQVPPLSQPMQAGVYTKGPMPGQVGPAVVLAVTRTETVPKSEFPTAAVYSDTKGPELRLITCGGTLDRSAHNYLGQTVVYAAEA